MSNQFDADFDAIFNPDFVEAGVADDATFTTGGVTIPCVAMITKDAQVVGSEGQIVGPSVTAKLFLAEVTPRAGAVLAVDPESWKLIRKVSSDDSSETWVIG